MGVGGGPGWLGRGAGRGTKGPFVAGAGEGERITQCPEAMLVTREPFSGALQNNLEPREPERDLTPWARGTRGP